MFGDFFVTGKSFKKKEYKDHSFSSYRSRIPPIPKLVRRCVERSQNHSYRRSYFAMFAGAWSAACWIGRSMTK
jgi:hypothetical protein